MINIVLIWLGKIFGLLSRILGKGNGSTWPGHIALKINKNFLQDIVSASRMKMILVVGTNGKTTTSKMLTTILEKSGKKVMQNTSGANLLNGLVSSFITNASLNGFLPYDYAIFEVDENTLPHVLNEVMPSAILVLNLFRDQLDRYGELDSIAKRWKTAFEKLPKQTSLITNADDPLVAYLGDGLKNPVYYFGMDSKDMTEKELSHAADSIYCPRCMNKLVFKKIAYSHLGDWHCTNCGLKRPAKNFAFQISSFQLPGMYNEYNALAAATAAKVLGITGGVIMEGLSSVKPAFGRQERIEKDGKMMQIFLAKNPTGFNESLRTISQMGAKNVLIVLNDRIPDGRDISWIWDMDIEQYKDKFTHITVSGDRVYDIALRLKYAGLQDKTLPFESLKEALSESLEILKKNETLYILPTYSAMLEVRKIITGKKI